MKKNIFPCKFIHKYTPYTLTRRSSFRESQSILGFVNWIHKGHPINNKKNTVA